MPAKATKTEIVTVNVTKPYRDIEKNLLFHKDETHEVRQERAKVLESKGVAKIISDKKE